MELASLPALPATTILPSGWTATSAPRSLNAPGTSVTTRPPVPKESSGVPSPLNRARPRPPAPNGACPDRTIFPSAWSAMPKASDSASPKSAVAAPLVPNVVSREPSGS